MPGTQARKRAARAGVSLVRDEAAAGDDVGGDESPRIDISLVGAQIRAHRTRRQLTLSDVATRIGCSASHLSQVEQGHRAPSLELLSNLAEVLMVPVSDLLVQEPPSKRVAFELAIERGQAHPAFKALGLSPISRSRRIPTLVLEHLAMLHQQLQYASHLVDPILLDEARMAHLRLWREQQTRNNYLRWIEDAATSLITAAGHPVDVAATHADLLDLARYLGYHVQYREDLPSSVEHLIDRRDRVIYFQGGALKPPSGEQARLDFARALAPIVLDHPMPTSLSDNLQYRMESSYFATTLLMPEQAALNILHKAKAERALSIPALQNHFQVPYRTAVLRMTNLLTEHLGIRVHYVASDEDARVLGGYENDGVPLPRDKNGAMEGQRMCRYWAARQPSPAQNSELGYSQYTHTPVGTFWSVSRAVADGRRLASVTFGTHYNDARWFLGSETRNQLTSRCPDPDCCTRPAPELSEPWANAFNIRHHHRDHPTIPPGGGMHIAVDLTGVLLFLAKYGAEDRRSGTESIRRPRKVVPGREARPAAS